MVPATVPGCRSERAFSSSATEIKICSKTRTTRRPPLRTAPTYCAPRPTPSTTRGAVPRAQRPLIGCWMFPPATRSGDRTPPDAGRSEIAGRKRLAIAGPPALIAKGKVQRRNCRLDSSNDRLRAGRFALMAKTSTRVESRTTLQYTSQKTWDQGEGETTDHSLTIGGALAGELCLGLRTIMAADCGARLVPSRSTLAGGRGGDDSGDLWRSHPLRVGTTRAPNEQKATARTESFYQKCSNGRQSAPFSGEFEPTHVGGYEVLKLPLKNSVSSVTSCSLRPAFNSPSTQQWMKG